MTYFIKQRGLTLSSGKHFTDHSFANIENYFLKHNFVLVTFRKVLSKMLKKYWKVLF